MPYRFRNHIPALPKELRKTRLAKKAYDVGLRGEHLALMSVVLGLHEGYPRFLTRVRAFIGCVARRHVSSVSSNKRDRFR